MRCMCAVSLETRMVTKMSDVKVSGMEIGVAQFEQPVPVVVQAMWVANMVTHLVWMKFAVLPRVGEHVQSNSHDLKGVVTKVIHYHFSDAPPTVSISIKAEKAT